MKALKAARFSIMLPASSLPPLASVSSVLAFVPYLSRRRGPQFGRHRRTNIISATTRVRFPGRAGKEVEAMGNEEEGGLV